MHFRNSVPFTATQIEAINSGMQPGLTMVGILKVILNNVVFVYARYDLEHLSSVILVYVRMERLIYF